MFDIEEAMDNSTEGDNFQLPMILLLLLKAIIIAAIVPENIY
jgi:hypothetical protein